MHTLEQVALSESGVHVAAACVECRGERHAQLVRGGCGELGTASDRRVRRSLFELLISQNVVIGIWTEGGTEFVVAAGSVELVNAFAADIDADRSIVADRGWLMGDPKKFSSEGGLRLSMIDGPGEIRCGFGIITIQPEQVARLDLSVRVDADFAKLDLSGTETKLVHEQSLELSEWS